MRRRTRVRKPPNSPVGVFLAIVACIAALYFAQDVLIPVALAVLFSFLLATPATWLERRGLGRVLSVLVVVLIATGILGTLTFVIGRQMYTLAESLPTYRGNIDAKVRVISRRSSGGVSDTIKNFGNDLTKVATEPTTQTTKPVEPPPPRVDPLTAGTDQLSQHPVETVAREELKAGKPATQPTTMPGVTAAYPLYVTTVDAPLSPLQLLKAVGEMVLGPLGTAGLVLVFVIFVLLEREGLRDRLIRLVSRGKYTVSTKAINDAATRITRYLLAQSMVNGTYGIAVAIGLEIIGFTLGHSSFPSFVLWGLLCAVLRFIPYVGPWMGASFPIVLSLAVYPGFHVVIAVLAMFIVIELISNNAMEPWLYGTSTGLSTVAILVAAVFWTWLWGPIGLLLSTPLTVCIVVTGKYVGQLAFLDVLLSDQAALPPSVSYYQRLLAGDRHEALALAREVLKEKGRDAVPDEVFVPAVLLARRDRADDDLTADTEKDIFAWTAEIIDDTLRPPEAKRAAKERADETQGAGASDATSPVAAPKGARVLGCPAHHRAEELILQMLGRLLGPGAGRMEIASTRLLTSEVIAQLTRDEPEVVFVAIVPPGGVVQARFLIRRLRKAAPDTRIVVGYFGRPRDFDRLFNRLRSAGASNVVTTVAQAYHYLQSALDLAPASDQSPDVLPPLPRTSADTESDAKKEPAIPPEPSAEAKAGGIADATPPKDAKGDVPVIQAAPPPKP